MLDEIDYLFNKIGLLDYYSFLGIEKQSSPDTIKSAYYQAAKKYHPDKHLHLTSDKLKTRLNSIFAHLTEIYRVLSDPVKKRQYDQSIPFRRVPETGNNRDLARIRFQEGEEAFRKGAFAEAKELFGQAVYLDSTVPAYYFLLGLSCAKAGDFREAAKALNQALTRDPDNADYLTELGYIYLKLGFSLRAQSTFEKAIRIKPLHAKAAEGLKRIKNTAG